MVRRTPLKPQSFKCFKNASQLALSSFAPSTMPRISRYPCALTPVATRSDTFLTSPAHVRFKAIHKGGRPRSASSASPRWWRRSCCSGSHRNTRHAHRAAPPCVSVNFAKDIVRAAALASAMGNHIPWGAIFGADYSRMSGARCCLT
jgi:hypothetical protein